jgi:hypothetical protein
MTGEPDEDDEIITCWCGASGTYEDLFDDACLDDNCNGLRTLNCYCGGDFCVCHHHGEVECPGCPHCEPDDEQCGQDEEVLP